MGIAVTGAAIMLGYDVVFIPKHVKLVELENRSDFSKVKNLTKYRTFSTLGIH